MALSMDVFAFKSSADAGQQVGGDNQLTLLEMANETPERFLNDCIPSGEPCISMNPGDCCSSKAGIFEDGSIQCIDNRDVLGEGSCFWEEFNGEWYVYDGYTGQKESTYYVCQQGALHAESFLCLDNFAGTEMLGRISGTSVTVNLVPCRNNISAYAEYGKQTGTYTHKTDILGSVTGEPLEILIDNLEPDTRYFYRVVIKQDDDYFLPRQEGTFTTRRKQGEPFVFAVTSDIHYYQIRNREEQKDIFLRTMHNIKEDNLDFHIDLGDSFCTDYEIVTDSVHDIKSQKAGYERYGALRTFFDDMHHSLPFFFVLGNHEGELGFNFENVALWSENARLLFIPNPDNTTYPEAGSPKENYYAFTWGNALFIMLDPYRYTTSEPTGDGNSVDDWTLGSEQLKWLEQTLENADTHYRFIFIHHLVGGCVGYGRGGAWCAGGGEWGTTIHPLLVEHAVDIVFHGHDHAFADEIRDGIRYTLVPVPHRGETEWATDNFYNWFKLRHNPGHVRVTVDLVDGCAAVQYIGSALHNNGGIVYSYSTGSACVEADEKCPIVQLFGSNSEETIALRYFRDEVLSKTSEGREIIKLYYQWRPALVHGMAGDESFKEEVKKMLDWIVPMIEETVQ
jgi:3',5'-cyclic AMP phosphodiesterase CpdA